jgi:hypothetical protein
MGQRHEHGYRVVMPWIAVYNDSPQYCAPFDQALLLKHLKFAFLALSKPCFAKALEH